MFSNNSIYTFRFKNNDSHSYIILEKQFILDKMNTVTHRLLGLNTDDELSTQEPSRDQNGAYTIFELLGIFKEHFIHLIYFLRIGRLDKEYHDHAMQAAIALGGFTALDEYIKEERRVISYPPKQPKDDIHCDYDWAVLSMLNEREINNIREKGFICTGIVAEVNHHVPHTYYRKLIKNG